MNYKNNSPEDNIERRLREIETELDRQYQTKPVTAETSDKKSPGRLAKMRQVGKAIAFSAVALAGIWVLTTVVSFVSMMLGFVIVGGVIYAAWKIIYSR
ncbi:hypothetical protein [Floridanema evergladense]|uniref:Uncharacterized protein n=1 Tax=Floridaenema evergladense BLCC-F167 TaxID=3153639 RepID=A0ABV4WJB6_9CYAN